MLTREWFVKWSWVCWKKFSDIRVKYIASTEPADLLHAIWRCTSEGTPLKTVFPPTDHPGLMEKERRRKNWERKSYKVTPCIVSEFSSKKTVFKKSNKIWTEILHRGNNWLWTFVVAPCSSGKAWRFVGTYCLHLQDQSVRQARNQPKQLEAGKSSLPNICCLAWLTAPLWRWRQ
jgi:hypothetical protein